MIARSSVSMASVLARQACGLWFGKVHGAALFETPAAEQHLVRQGLQPAMIDHPLEVGMHFLAALAVDHAVQVVTPLREMTRTPVTKGDEIETGEALTQLCYA